MLIILPSPLPCHFLSSSLIPNPLLSAEVATSIKSLLRPRVALRTSPGDGVCLRAGARDVVSVFLSTELSRRWEGRRWSTCSRKQETLGDVNPTLNPAFSPCVKLKENSPK